MSIFTSGLNLYDKAGSSTGNNSQLTVSGGSLYLSGVLFTAGGGGGGGGTVNTVPMLVTASNTNLVSGNYAIVGSTGSFTLTLPGAPASGQTYLIKNKNTGVITITGGTIDGSPTLYLSQYQAATMIYDGSVWNLF